MGRSKKHNKRNASVAVLPVGNISISKGGYGFVECSEGRFFIKKKWLGGAMDGDLVRIRPRSSDWQCKASNTSRQKKDYAPNASVERVLQRSHKTLVGICVSYDEKLYIIPQDERVDYLIELIGDKKAPLRAEDRREVYEGDIVLARIVTYPSRYETPSASLIKIIGRDGDEGILEEIIASKHGIETETSPELTALAEKITLDIDTALKEPDRKDIRDRFILTIDPPDAKDFDDALSLEEKNGQLCLGVHIADVSEYVHWGTLLDSGARSRATSTYFPGKVYPMLPHHLSDELCSLMPEADRLAFTVDIYLKPDFRVDHFEAYPSVIRSKLRLDYEKVQEMFDGKREYPNKEASFVLEGLRKIATKLYEMRLKRGALAFKSNDLKVILDDEGHAVGIEKKLKNDATSLVEEAMILCNEIVASTMLYAGYPMVYRVHEEPEAASLEYASNALNIFGLAQGGLCPSDISIGKILEEVTGRPEEEIVGSILLRAMKQAVYKDKFTEHFGLASSAYCHFTSPIRRYPDLMVHRLFRLYLFEEAKKRGTIRQNAEKPEAIKGLESMVEKLSYLAKHCSEMERRAEKASYDALESKICEYMGKFEGERFSATITDVRSFAFYIRLENGVSGVVSLRNSGADFDFDEDHFLLQNVDNIKEAYQLGQSLSVILETADKQRGQLKFSVDKTDKTLVF